MQIRAREHSVSNPGQRDPYELMYLPRVQANTQIKSEAYKPKVDTIKGEPMKVGT